MGQPDRVPELLDLAEADTETWPYAMVVLTQLMTLDPDDALALAERELPAVLERFHETGDERGLAQAQMARFWVEWLRCHAGPAASAARQAAEHARRAGDRAVLSDALGWLCGTTIHGPADPATMQDTVATAEQEDGGAYVVVGVEYVRAKLAASRRFEEARAHNREAERVLAEHGLGLMHAARDRMAEAELAAETYGNAIVLLRRAYDALLAIGDRGSDRRSRPIWRRRCTRPEFDEARAALEAEELSGKTDLMNFAMGRGVRRIQADRGERERAEELARCGSRLRSRPTFRFRASALLALAHVLRAAQRNDEALEAVQKAVRSTRRRATAYRPIARACSFPSWLQPADVRFALRCSAILLDRVTKRFGDTVAVHDASLCVEHGEVVSVLGPSGCGKTTLLRLIAGFEAPDSGTVRLADVVVAGAAWMPPERRRVGMVFQDYALFPHLTVAENVGFGLPRERLARVPELLGLVDLRGLGSRYPHELSGGQQQRVALARALAPSPELVLLDEPWSNVDPHLRTELRDEVTSILRPLGVTVVLVTHDREEAFSLADRIALLRAGTVVQEGTPEESTSPPGPLGGRVRRRGERAARTGRARPRPHGAGRLPGERRRAPVPSRCSSGPSCSSSRRTLRGAARW